MYFNHCKTAEEVKAAYKEQVKALHPDNHPERDTTAEFQAMQAEYMKAWDRLKNIHTNEAGETYTKETTETAAEYMDLIDKLMRIPGILIELCGSWLWITGDTYTSRDTLKALGFHWASKKHAWYYHKDPWHGHGCKGSLDDIRIKYGSQSVQSRGLDGLDDTAAT